MKHITRLQSVFMAVAMALVVVACGPSKEEIQKKQIDELTAELKQLDDNNNKLESRMDSLIKDKQTLTEQLAKAKDNTELKNKLAATNAAITAVKAENAKLASELDKFKMKSDSLGKANAALAEQVKALTARAEEAETKLAAAEQRAADLDTQLQTATATINKTYAVSKFEVIGQRKGEEDKKGKIRTNADELRFVINLTRPAGAKATPETKMVLHVTYPDGSMFYKEACNIKNDADSHVIPVKERKMDLRKGKYAVKLMDAADNSVKYEGSFLVVGVL
jgi:DNA repair exonuclease SbcCD ATPase subunit